jgi:hypothetical protein
MLTRATTGLRSVDNAASVATTTTATATPTTRRREGFRFDGSASR